MKPQQGGRASQVNTVCKRFRVDRREIAFLRFIFEGYDGVAFVSTIDREAGVVEICAAPGCESEVTRILAGLAGEILIEPVAGREPGPVRE